MPFASGGLSEWSMVADLKSAGRKPQGFESSALRQFFQSLNQLINVSILSMYLKRTKIPRR